LDGLRVEPEEWQLVESGSSSVVVLAGPVAIRVARDAIAGAALRRVQQLVDQLPELPFGLPRSVGPVIDHDGLVAVATHRLPGQPHPHGSGDPAELRRLLEAIHTVDVEPLRNWLAPARSFAGGPRWHEVMTNEVLPRLPEDVRAEAAARVGALAGLRSPLLGLNHGDLAGSNVLWQEGRVVGVLDWDLAAEDDPAEDLASLAGWHGWDLVQELADAETVARATVFRRSFPLQIIAFQIVHQRPEDEVERAVQRALPALRRSPH
jgi:aminoglycoside phosphotransferase (APT) family kinase protein